MEFIFDQVFWVLFIIFGPLFQKVVIENVFRDTKFGGKINLIYHYQVTKFFILFPVFLVIILLLMRILRTDISNNAINILSNIAAIISFYIASLWIWEIVWDFIWVFLPKSVPPTYFLKNQTLLDISDKGKYVIFLFRFAILCVLILILLIASIYLYNWFESIKKSWN